MSNLPPEHSYEDQRDYSVVGLPESPQRRAGDFVRLLYELTPQTYVTPILIGINAIVFVLMFVFGVSPISPTTADLLRWGADFGPLTIGGEWWRLLTSMFLHIGLIHIGFNMWVLYAAGPLVERMVGNVGFLLMYLVAGLCGGLASLSWNPAIVSAGASGAIFGIYGCLLGLVLRGKGSIPPQILVQLRSSGTGFLFYNLIFGMMIPNIDMAAHLGGLAGGFLCGLVLSQPFTEAAKSGRVRRNLLLVGLGICLVAAGIFGVTAWHSARVRIERELKALFPPTENQIVLSMRFSTSSRFAVLPRNSSGQTSLRMPALRCLGAENAGPGCRQISRLRPAAAPWSNCMNAVAGSSRGGLWNQVIGQAVASGLLFSDRSGNRA